MSFTFVIIVSIANLIVWIASIKLYSLYVQPLDKVKQVSFYFVALLVFLSGIVGWIITAVMLVIFILYKLFSLMAGLGENDG